MAKKSHVVQMVGVLKDGTKATPQKADQVHIFRPADNKVDITVHDITPTAVMITTRKGSYRLPVSITKTGLYMGEANGIKVHFSPKKIVAKLIYWA